MPPTIRCITAQETLALRQLVLWPDRPISHVMVQDDDIALHLGAFDGDTLIGVGSFYPDAPNARLRKLAVAPEYRGIGLGVCLVQHGADLMAKKGLRTLWCDARKDAHGFYEKLGFVMSDEVFEKSGIEYVKAQLDLGA